MMEVSSQGRAIPESWLHWRMAFVVATSVVCLLFAIEPLSRSDWLLENALTALFAIGFAISWRQFCFSPVAHLLLFVFLSMHALGSHYTYEKVPYDLWWQDWTGSSLNASLGFERNHYDRLVHLCYGLFLVQPVRELVRWWSGPKGLWAYLIPISLVMSSSMLYELIEWGAAEILGGELTHAYLGSQGDVWDAHRDMALASLGGLLSTFVIWQLNVRRQATQGSKT
jgi:putative membrane protein